MLLIITISIPLWDFPLSVYTPHYTINLCRFVNPISNGTVSSFVEFSSGIIHERISDFFAKCGHGHQSSPRRRQSHASLAEIEWRRELRHHRFNMPSDSTPATLQFPYAFPAVIAYCSCGKAWCPCPHPLRMDWNRESDRRLYATTLNCVKYFCLHFFYMGI